MPNLSLLLVIAILLSHLHEHKQLREYTLFRSNIVKENLPTYLIALCKYFYEQGSEKELLPGSTYANEAVEEKKISVKKMIWQCSHCLTVYDDETGEPGNDIAAGTLFEALPATWCCPLCESPKNEFKQIEKNMK